MNPSRQSTSKPRSAYARNKELPNLRRFAENLKTAFNRCLPSHQKPFGQVGVLALHWQNNDLPCVESLEEELLQVLGKVYNFHTEAYEISPNIQVQRNTEWRINRFLEKWDTEDGLTIVIYSGHAAESYTGHQGLTWET
jgi:hypothetical protein